MINTIELVCCLTGIGLQVMVLLLRRCHGRELIVAAIAVTPVTVLAATAFTRFLGWDESYIFYDIVNYYTSNLPQWGHGSFRTSILTLGPFLHLLQSVLPLSKDLVLVGAKVLHWLSGVLLVTLITDQLLQWRAPRAWRGILHAGIYNCIMVLPVTVCALKTLNYDLLSMLGGMLGMLWCLQGCHENSWKRNSAGVVLLTLAAQEKLIASPLLWLFLVVVPVWMTVRSRENFSVQTVRLLRYTFASLMVSVATVAITYMFVYVLHGPNRPVFTADQFFSCWKSFFWPLFRLVYPVFFTSMTNGSLVTELSRIPVYFLILYVAVNGMAMAVLYGIRNLNLMKKTKYHHYPRGNYAAILRLGLLVLITVAGVVAQYHITVKIWPFAPVATGKYIPTVTFNGIVHHFSSPTLIMHLFASMVWECAVFLNALPTGLLLLLFIAAVARIRNGGTFSDRKLQWAMDLLALLFFSAPLLFGIAQIPQYSRYLNLFILGCLVTALPDILPLLIRPIKQTAGIVIVFILLLLVETEPFQPLQDTFRPVWSNYSSRFMQRPNFGSVAPWYPGWGEELFKAFRILEQRGEITAEPVRLYHNFPAALIRPPATVVTSAMPKGQGTLSYRFQDNDYYIFSRNGISTYVYLPFPANTAPLFTIADRGFVNTWVFRGSDLERTGYPVRSRE
jgi:hypothetical protein